jgi:hypothetical protein
VSRPRADVVLLWVIGAHVLLKSVLFFYAGGGDEVGDEIYYLDGGRELSNLVRDLVAFKPIDTTGLERNVVGNGWFMPGMSILLTPLFIVFPDASYEQIRGYLGLTSTLLMIAAALNVRRVLGPAYATAMVAFPGLVPVWILFSYGAWGDLMAGLVIVFLVTQLIVIFRGLADGVPPTLWQGAKLGLTGITIVYLRSSALVVVLALFAMVLVGLVFLLRSRSRWRGVAAFGSASAVFVMLLLPWSLSVSSVMDTRVTTTTSVPTVLANTFGDRSEVCFGPCDPGSMWFGPLRYSREVARETGHSELEVQAEMSAYARQDVTATSYADQVLYNIGLYVVQPQRFVELIRPESLQDGWQETTLEIFTMVLFFAALPAVLVAFLTAYRRPYQDQVLNLVLKLGVGALLTQPFVHICGSRYWTTAGPLWAMMVVLAWQQRRGESREPAVADAAEVPGTITRSLYAVQVALVATTGLVAAGLVVLALVGMLG